MSPQQQVLPKHNFNLSNGIMIVDDELNRSEEIKYCVELSEILASLKTQKDLDELWGALGNCMDE